MSIYSVTMAEDGMIRVCMAEAGNEIVKFSGATSLLVYMTWVNLCGQGDNRADDYIAGFVQGLTYCTINGAPTTGDTEGTKEPVAKTGGTLAVKGGLSVVDKDGHAKD